MAKPSSPNLWIVGLAVFGLALGACSSDGANGPVVASSSTARSAPTTALGSTPTPAPASSPSPTAPPPSVSRNSADCSRFATSGNVVARECVARRGSDPIAIIRYEDAPAGASVIPRSRVVLHSLPSSTVIADLATYPAGAVLLDPEAGQVVELLAPVDFDGDGTDSLAVAVLAIGASTGPLRIAVLSFRGDDVALDFEQSTTRGGMIAVDGSVLVLEAGAYEPGDPGCCPSGLLKERIGWDPETKRVTVLTKTVTPVTR